MAQNYLESPQYSQINAITVTRRARDIGLDVLYHTATIGDGNCWYRALIQQIHRSDIIHRLNPNYLFVDCHLLRLAVVSYVRQNQESDVRIQNYRNLMFPQDGQWEDLLSRQEVNGTYATDIFCQCSAYLLNVEVRITTADSTREQPYFSLNSNSTSGVIFWISNSNNQHFQSLIPRWDSSVDFQITNSALSNVMLQQNSAKKDIFKPVELKKEYNNTLYYKKYESKMSEKCQENNVLYVPPKEGESKVERIQRVKDLKNLMKGNSKRKATDCCKKTSKRSKPATTKGVDNDGPNQSKSQNNQNSEPTESVYECNQNPSEGENNQESNSAPNNAYNHLNDIHPDIHPNPKVRASIKKFEEGENKHVVATCCVCMETRPVFNSSYNANSTHVKILPWKINRKGMCSRCQKDRTNRGKKDCCKAAKFSGHLSSNEDLGPSTDALRHNGMHFESIPPYLKNLSAVELALVSKISISINVHLLRFGMLSSKGHTVSVPQRMNIACNLPQLPENVGIIVLKRKGSKSTTRQYSVKRSSVESAIKGLCYGFPHGGLANEASGLKKYDGPNHLNMPLNGKYFQFLPNPYYRDVIIKHERLQELPEERAEYPHLNVVEVEKEIPEEDKGPAPAQFHVPFSPDDESTTRSGITCPMEPKDMDKELGLLLKKLTGKNEIDPDTVALADWEYCDEAPLQELKTPGFFTMAFPGVFVNGSGDITHNRLVNIQFDDWVDHIYHTGDNRVSQHSFLKFFLHNLGLRKKALDQGNFLVAQQLNEAHLSVEELAEHLNNDDASVPRKIISMATNLVNTDPYWMDRKRELDAFTFFHKKESGDLPCYFHTNSLAELHWSPLIKLLSKYKAAITGIDEATIQEELQSNSNLLRRTVLENLHIVTHYFDARTKNYYNTVCKDLFDCTDFWYRYEFAKSRGQIHSHGIIFSSNHASKIENALNSESEEEKAENLFKWLQTEEENGDGIYSPQFVSMHPAGGNEMHDEEGNKTWIPNKDGWPYPEGNQQPPETDPLTMNLADACKSSEEVNHFHSVLTNRVGLHQCNGNCLRKKNRESESRYCRMHFGKEDPVTKKTPGKDLHPFNATITGQNNHPRYEGPRDHSRMIMHVKAHLMSWLANCDTQPIIDQDLLNLQKYICAYACKGHASTEDFITIYRHLLDSADTTSSIKNVVHRLMMKIVGMVDVPGAAADFINTGGKLYHSTRHFRRVGLSGYRPLNTKANGENENVTKKTPLDQYLGEKRREKYPEMSLWDWSVMCECRSKCLSSHVPVFTGALVKPVWPLSEEFCMTQLMIFSKGTWKKTEDLKEPDETFSDAFARFLDSEECPPALSEVVALAKTRYEKKLEKDMRKNEGVNEVLSQESNSTASQLTSSQNSMYNDFQLGQALLKDINENNKVSLEKMLSEPVLYDGGPNFDWHKYGIECLGQAYCHDSALAWLEEVTAQAGQRILQHANNCDLPSVNLLLANRLQRVIIAINIVKMLDIVNNNAENLPPLRMIIQGTAGTGKTFVINALSNITRRLFRRNGSVMNLAPTGAASNLLPGGRTVHSITPPLSKNKKKEYKTAQMADYPMTNKALRNLRNLIGYQEDKSHKLYCLNMDERSMFSHRLLAWCSQRFSEATSDFDNCFGSIPIVNFFGDIGQLGPIDAKDLHVSPGNNSAPDELKGYAIYRSFTDCILLEQTMRQKPEQKNLLERLLRIRSGNVTQQDWLDINARYEKNLPVIERQQFEHNRVLTLHETWAEVRKENRIKLASLSTPIAVIPSTGRGHHHKRGGEKPVAQIMPQCILAVGSRTMLSKNQGVLTSFGLNNGAMGTVISIMYPEHTGPPSMPYCAVVDFESYNGPTWLDQHPTWVPIFPKSGRDETNCCSRTGLPLMPGYSIPIAKSQGMTVGNNKPATHMRVKLQSEKFMESLSLGTSYTAFSRVESEDRWCLVEEIPMDRLLYINQHPHIPHRRAEEKRLKNWSNDTVLKYSDYSDPNNYLQLLQQVDELCNDGISYSVCSMTNESCKCLHCQPP